MFEATVLIISLIAGLITIGTVMVRMFWKHDSSNKTHFRLLTKPTSPPFYVEIGLGEPVELNDENLEIIVSELSRNASDEQLKKWLSFVGVEQAQRQFDNSNPNAIYWRSLRYYLASLGMSFDEHHRSLLFPKENEPPILLKCLIGHMSPQLKDEFGEEMEDFVRDGLGERANSKLAQKSFVLTETLSMALTIVKRQIFSFRMKRTSKVVKK